MQDPASDPCSVLRHSLSLSIREQEVAHDWGLMICRLKHAWGPGQGWAGWQEALGPHEAVIKSLVARLQRSTGSGYSHRGRNEEGALRNALARVPRLYLLLGRDSIPTRPPRARARILGGPA